MHALLSAVQMCLKRSTMYALADHNVAHKPETGPGLAHHAIRKRSDAGRQVLELLGRELVLLDLLPQPPVAAVAPRVRHAVRVHRHRVVVPARYLQGQSLGAGSKPR